MASSISHCICAVVHLKWVRQMINKLKQETKKLGTILFGLIFLFPAVGQACSVCFTGKEGSLPALYLSTAILICLPLIFVVTVYKYVQKKYREHSEAEHSEEGI